MAAPLICMVFYRNFMGIMFFLSFYVYSKSPSRYMGKRNLPAPPEILGRQEWSVLSSWPKEES